MFGHLIPALKGRAKFITTLRVDLLWDHSALLQQSRLRPQKVMGSLPRRGYVLQPEVAGFGGYLGNRSGKPATAKRLRPARPSHVPSTDATTLRLNFVACHSQRSRSGNVGLEGVAPSGLLFRGEDFLGKALLRSFNVFADSSAINISSLRDLRNDRRTEAHLLREL